MSSLKNNFRTCQMDCWNHGCDLTKLKNEIGIFHKNHTNLDIGIMWNECFLWFFFHLLSTKTLRNISFACQVVMFLPNAVCLSGVRLCISRAHKIAPFSIPFGVDFDVASHNDTQLITFYNPHDLQIWFIIFPH